MCARHEPVSRQANRDADDDATSQILLCHCQSLQSDVRLGSKARVGKQGLYLYKKTGSEPEKDFTPVASLAVINLHAPMSKELRDNLKALSDKPAT